MNTQPMGVIPRIHEVYGYLYGKGAPMSMLDDLGDVLQAIAELIAADEEYDRARMNWLVAVSGTGSVRMSEASPEMVSAKKRRSAALSRVTGEA